MEQQQPHSARSIGQGTLWSVFNNGLSQVLVLAVFLVTARFVSQEAFGIMAICFITLELFKQIAIESITTALIAKKSPSDEDYNACFIINIVLSVVTAAIIYFLAKPMASFLENEDLVFALHATSILILSSGLSRTHEAWLVRHLKFKALAMRSLFSIVVGGATGITLAVHGYGLVSLVAQQVLTSVIGTIFVWGATQWNPQLKTTTAKLKTLLNDSKYIALTGISNFLNGQSDIFFSAYYLGATATGIYNAAKRIIIAINAIIPTALAKVALPVFATLQEDDEKLRNSFLVAVSYTTFITAPAYFGIAALSPELINILLGEKWLSASPILSILVIGSYFTTVGQYSYNIFLVKGKSHWQTYLTTLYAIVNVALFFIFAKYGLLALAGALTARTILLYPVSATAALSLIKLPVGPYIKGILPSLIASIIMASIVFYISHSLELSSLVKLMILIPLGVVIYGLLMWFLDNSKVRELALIINKYLSNA